MTSSTVLVVTVFAAVYVGMALGRWPGLKLDRSGIALLGAIALVLAGAVSGQQAIVAIDFATIVVLFGLMILSAQFAACGFYDWCAAHLAAAKASPAALLAATVAVSGALSAVLANDIVVFAMTPLLISGLQRRGLDPRPYLIGLAGGANAGSAATLIGNPQNILIGQVGGLDFWSFVAACAPPALSGLAVVFGVTWLAWRRHIGAGAPNPVASPAPPLDRLGLGKAIVAVALLLALFTSPLPHATGVLAVTGALLVSRRLASRDMIALVDWHLLLLFAGLFIVTAALTGTGLIAATLSALANAGIVPHQTGALLPLTLIGSNTVGNVPLVVLLLAALPALHPESLYQLAVYSTLAGNFLIVGSIANIIVVERARQAGVVLGFAAHASCGVPITLASLALAAGWFYLRGAGAG